MADSNATRSTDSRPLWRRGMTPWSRRSARSWSSSSPATGSPRRSASCRELRRELEQRASRTTRQVLHRFNLPAATDVTRLLNEIGELKKQVRKLSEQLERRPWPSLDR